MHSSLDPSRVRFHFSQNMHAKKRMDGLWRHLLIQSSEAAHIYVNLKWGAQMIHHSYKFGSQIRLKLIVGTFFTTLWSRKSSNPFKQWLMSKRFLGVWHYFTSWIVENNRHSISFLEPAISKAVWREPMVVDRVRSVKKCTRLIEQNWANW